MVDEILSAVLDEIEREVLIAEKSNNPQEKDKCIFEIDFQYYTLRRYNSGILPWSDKRFQELNRKVEKIKRKRD